MQKLLINANIFPTVTSIYIETPIRLERLYFLYVARHILIL